MSRRFIRGATIMATLAASAGMWCNLAFCDDAHHHDHAHDISGLELGASAGYVELQGGDGAISLHLHAMKRLGDEGLSQSVAIGPGTEFIFGDHEHYTVMLSLTVYPWRGLTLTVAPGIEWATHEGEWESRYATHVEAGYVFEVGKYDVGPTIGYSASGDEDHYSIGVHAGLHL
jgi:hypothetical protein